MTEFGLVMKIGSWMMSSPSSAVALGIAFLMWAAGTGKATFMLAYRGLVGVGVEPDPKMAAIAEAKLADRSGWRVDAVPPSHGGQREQLSDILLPLSTVVSRCQIQR